MAGALPHDDLVPDLEEGVPGPGADRHPVLCYPETRHPVIVASKNTFGINNIRYEHLGLSKGFPSHRRMEYMDVIKIQHVKIGKECLILEGAKTPSNIFVCIFLSKIIGFT